MATNLDPRTAAYDAVISQLDVLRDAACVALDRERTRSARARALALRQLCDRLADALDRERDAWIGGDA